MTDAIGIAPRTRARSRARLMPRFLSLVKAAKILAQDSTQLELNCVIHMTCHDTPPLPVPRSNHLRKKIKYRVGRRSSIHPSIHLKVVIGSTFRLQSIVLRGKELRKTRQVVALKSNKIREIFRNISINSFDRLIF